MKTKRADNGCFVPPPFAFCFAVLCFVPCKQAACTGWKVVGGGYDNRNMVNPILHSTLFSRALSALVWALAAAGVVFRWAQVSNLGAVRQANVAAPAPLHVAAQDVAYALGVRAAQPVAEAAVQKRSTYELVGVLAGTRSQRGAALIAVDGKKPKPYQVGATIDGEDGFVLQALQGRTARLGTSMQGATAQALEMPPFTPTAAPVAPAARAPSPSPSPAAGAAVPAPASPGPGLQRAQ